MRSFMLVVFCSAVVFASLSSAYAYNPFQAGFRASTACFADKLFLDTEVYIHEPEGPSTWVNENFEEVKTFAPGNGEKITMIKATDVRKNGASVHILKGGIGEPSITLKFQNKGVGFHFHVEVYASKK